MTVYADVLILINTFINYFLLIISAAINKLHHKSVRVMFGALSGGILSLTIFLPITNTILNIVVKIITASIMVLVSFKTVNFKCFIRNVLTLFTITYLYAGIMLGIWYIFKPQSILINNSIVYFDVSVLFLVISTAMIYVAITVVGSIFKRNAVNAKQCRAKLFLKEKIVILNAIIDTGNSLEDFINNREIVTVDSKVLNFLCDGKSPNSEYFSDRYRVLPCKTVSGDTLLEGIRCDKMEVEIFGENFEFENPIAVCSKTRFTDDFNAVLNAEILTKLR